MERSITFNDVPDEVAQIKAMVTQVLMLLTKPAEPPQPQQFGVSGLHTYIRSKGLEMSPSKQQKLCANGLIPCSKFNNKLVFNQDEIDRWIESQTTQNTKANVKSDATLLLAQSATRKLKGGKTA